MNTSSLSSYLIGGAVGVVIATGIFDGPLSLVSAAQFFQPAAPIKTDVTPRTIVDRSGKGDRLPLKHPDVATSTTIVFKRGDQPAAVGNEAADRKLVPASLKECEPLASPFADPALGRFAARCFV